MCGLLFESSSVIMKSMSCRPFPLYRTKGHRTTSRSLVESGYKNCNDLLMRNPSPPFVVFDVVFPFFNTVSTLKFERSSKVNVAIIKGIFVNLEKHHGDCIQRIQDRNILDQNKGNV